jgi:NADH:ubiquinone oxidoreductase subunit K
VVREVFALNLVLAALAIASTRPQSPVITVLLVAAGALAVALALYRFSRLK